MYGQPYGSHKGWPLSCCLRLLLIAIRQGLFNGIGSPLWTPINYLVTSY